LFLPLHQCHYLMVRLWKTLLAYQFVVQADRDKGSREAQSSQVERAAEVGS
jgi:hypothetical protein